MKALNRALRAAALCVFATSVSGSANAATVIGDKLQTRYPGSDAASLDGARGVYQEGGVLASSGNDQASLTPTGITSAIIKANPLTFSKVPETATWALMIGGFGLVGAGMRRQRVTATHA